MVISAAAKRDHIHIVILIAFCFLGLLPTACGPSSDGVLQPTIERTSNGENGVSTQTDTGYPAPYLAAAEPYPGSTDPGAEGILPEPPNPPRFLPTPEGDFGVIGGVLVREITEQGFLPVTPRKLILGEVLSNDLGTPSYIRSNERSLQAELLAAGVFRFGEVPPGTYSLVIDLGFTQFPITKSGGEDFLITVRPGQVYDLGQIFVELPSGS